MILKYFSICYSVLTFTLGNTFWNIISAYKVLRCKAPIFLPGLLLSQTRITMAERESNRPNYKGVHSGGVMTKILKIVDEHLQRMRWRAMSKYHAQYRQTFQQNIRTA